MLKQTKD